MKTKLLIGLLSSAILSTLLYLRNIIGGQILICIFLVIMGVAYVVVDSILLEKGRDSTLLLKASGFLLAAVILVFGWYIPSKYEYQLYTKGIQAVATVSKYEKTVSSGRKGRVRYNHTHTIVYEGYTTKLDLPEQYTVGTQLHIRYLPSYPKFARIIEPGATVYSMLDWGTGVMFLIVVILIGFSGLYLKEFSAPAP